MFCPMCGAPNDDDAEYCGNCGAALSEDAGQVETPQEGTPDEVTTDQPEAEVLEEEMAVAAPQPVPSAAAPQPQTSGLAIASLVLGICGWTILPLVGSILAIITGYMARKEIRENPDGLAGDGMALAGLVLGWVSIGLGVLLLCLGGLGACFFFGLAAQSGGMGY